MDRENARLLIPDAECHARGKAALDDSRSQAKYSVGRERRPGGIGMRRASVVSVDIAEKMRNDDRGLADDTIRNR